MKRDAFSMIELIFVIIIIGILAAVSLPKFMKVTDNAESTKCKAFIGTLNRTVSHSIWSEALMEDRENLATSVTEQSLSSQIEFPAVCGSAAEYASAATEHSSFIVTIAEHDYNVSGFTPTETTPAKWKWSK